MALRARLEKGPPIGAVHAEISPGNSDSLDRSITLHLKISCPPSPAFSHARNTICSVPQFKIEMESDYNDANTERGRRDLSGETTL